MPFPLKFAPNGLKRAVSPGHSHNGRAATEARNVDGLRFGGISPRDLDWPSDSGNRWPSVCGHIRSVHLSFSRRCIAARGPGLQARDLSKGLVLRVHAEIGFRRPVVLRHQRFYSRVAVCPTPFAKPRQCLTPKVLSPQGHSVGAALYSVPRPALCLESGQRATLRLSSSAPTRERALRAQSDIPRPQPDQCSRLVPRDRSAVLYTGADFGDHLLSPVHVPAHRVGSRLHCRRNLPISPRRGKPPATQFIGICAIFPGWLFAGRPLLDPFASRKKSLGLGLFGGLARFGIAPLLPASAAISGALSCGPALLWRPSWKLEQASLRSSCTNHHRRDVLY